MHWTRLEFMGDYNNILLPKSHARFRPDCSRCPMIRRTAVLCDDADGFIKILTFDSVEFSVLLELGLWKMHTGRKEKKKN